MRHEPSEYLTDLRAVVRDFDQRSGSTGLEDTEVISNDKCEEIVKQDSNTTRRIKLKKSLQVAVIKPFVPTYVHPLQYIFERSLERYICGRSMGESRSVWSCDE